MTTTKTQTELQKRVLDLKNTIKDRQTEREALLKQRDEFAEALRLLGQVPATVTTSHAPFEQLRRLVEQAESEQEKRARIQQARTALDATNERLRSLGQEIDRLLLELARTEASEQWEAKYSKAAERYRSEYQFPATQKQAQIQNLRQSIQQRQQQLASLNGTTIHPYFKADPESIRTAIAELQAQLGYWQRQPDQQPDQSGFKEYVQERADLEPLLEAFLKVQSEYWEAMTKLYEALPIEPQGFVGGTVRRVLGEAMQRSPKLAIKDGKLIVQE